MRTILLVFCVAFALTSCEKDDPYILNPVELEGRWNFDKVIGIDANIKDDALKDHIVRVINNREGCSVIEYFEFKLENAKPSYIARGVCFVGIMGVNNFEIDSKNNLKAIGDIEAYDLKVVGDSLFLTLDDTFSFQRDYGLSVKKIMTRIRYVKTDGW